MNRQEKMAQPAKVSDALFIQLRLSDHVFDNSHYFNKFDKSSTVLKKKIWK